MKEKLQHLAILISLRIDDPGRNEIDITPPLGIPIGGLKNKGSTTGQEILRSGLTFVIIVSILLTLLFLLWGGISWITSGGDKAKLDAARKKIIYSIVGLLVVFFSFLIVSLIGDFFGINILP